MPQRAPEFNMAVTNETSLEASDVYDDGCLRVEHDKFYVACGGRPLYNLTLKEFRIFSRLVREIGRPVPMSALWASGWREDAEFDDDAAKLLKVHISTLRRKLKPFGIQIFSKPNIGYILSTDDCVCAMTDATTQQSSNLTTDLNRVGKEEPLRAAAETEGLGKA
jgi:DNA-binding response OmpR family regulator